MTDARKIAVALLDSSENPKSFLVRHGLALSNWPSIMKHAGYMRTNALGLNTAFFRFYPIYRGLVFVSATDMQENVNWYASLTYTGLTIQHRLRNWTYPKNKTKTLLQTIENSVKQHQLSGAEELRSAFNNIDK